jgi:hypothetical protein
MRGSVNNRYNRCKGLGYRKTISKVMGWGMILKIRDKNRRQETIEGQ